MPRRFDKCVLHIGTEKTGTTTLQRFLGTNRQVLATLGYFVPRSLSPYKVLANHERLTTVSLGLDKLKDDLRCAAGLRTVDDVIAHRAKVKEEFQLELGEKDYLPANLLLSNEHCHSRLTSDGEVQTLHDFLSEYVREFQLVVYLRPQHELATSLYDQALKAGYADINVLPNLEGNSRRWVERKYFDYDDLTSRWERVFGPGSLRPRVFARHELAGGSIIDDFLGVIGSDVRGTTIPKDENRSISSTLQSVLNSVNRYAKAHPEFITAQDRACLIARLQELSSGNGRQPTQSEAMEFYRRFAESNERVCRRYFPQRESLFDPDFSGFPCRPSEAPSETDALVEALLAIAVPWTRRTDR